MVLGLAFLLLLVTFRSIVIPITSIVLNPLSIGAAYDVLVLILQQGQLQSLLGFTSIGGTTDWVPLFLFLVLFRNARSWTYDAATRRAGVGGVLRSAPGVRRGQRPQLLLGPG